MKVAFAGQRGAYSEAAAAALFPFDIATTPLPTIDQVFGALMSNEATKAVVPIEKSESGYISQTFSWLRRERLFITGSVMLSTAYVLAGPRGASESTIKRIHAHPHALTACENFLRGHPEYELVPRFDVQHAETTVVTGGSPADGLLCSRFSALRRGLNVIVGNVSNQADASTRYVAVGTEPILPPASDGQAYTTVLFTIEDKAGALMRKLAVFAELGLNIIRLKVFPPGGDSKFTTAFVTYAGRYNEHAAGRALEVIQETSPGSRHLGSYTIRDLRGMI